jgi:hypothetical protein
MATNYLNSFNVGELSDYLNGRIDIDKYKNGCKVLENMFVLPYGGVQRRTGTKYLGDALSENSRLFLFNFTNDESYVVEIGVDENDEGKIRVWANEALTAVELDSPFEASDLPYLKYRRVFDTMFIVCPNKRPYRLVRTDIEPNLSFAIEEIPWEYPPFMQQNLDFETGITIDPIAWTPNTDYEVGDIVENTATSLIYECILDHTSGAVFAVGSDWTLATKEDLPVIQDSKIKLVSTTPIFSETMVDSYFRLSHQRGGRELFGEGKITTDVPSSPNVYIGSKAATVSFYSSSPANVIIVEYRQGRTGAWTAATGSPFSGKGIFSVNIAAGTDRYVRIYYDTQGASSKGESWEIYGQAQTNILTGSSTVDFTSEQLDVSFSNWNILTEGTGWRGWIDVQRSTDGGQTWENYKTVGVPVDGSNTNFTISSPAKEGKNTKIRIFYNALNATKLTFTIKNETTYSEGIVKLTEYIDEYTMNGVVDNSLLSYNSTIRWSEGEFSDKNGYPASVEIFENRLIFAGTRISPSTIWMSQTDGFYNFLKGVLADEAIIITPNNAEPTNWLISREFMIQGNNGGLNRIFSVNSNTNVTPDTVKVSDASAFGTGITQAKFANDVIVYMQRLDKKLRSVVWSDEEQGFVSQDLTILAPHITGTGVKEIDIQQVPDQIIWGLRNDGTLCGMTFERNEGIQGWHHHDFGGEVKSFVIKPVVGDDEMWIVVKRTNGTFIEKTLQREFADDLSDAWFVDSAVKTELNPIKYVDSIDVDGFLTISGAGSSGVDGKYKFIGSSVNVFDDISRPYFDNILNIDYSGFTDSDFEAVSGNRTYHMWPAGGERPNIWRIKEYEVIFLDEFAQWYIEERILYTNVTSGATPPLTGWGFDTWTDPEYNPDTVVGIEPAPILNWTEFRVYSTSHGLTAGDLIRFSDVVGTDELNGNIYYVSDVTADSFKLKVADGSVYIDSTGFGEYISGGSFVQVTNILSGLDHLEGETIQIVGDAGYVGDYVVSGGVVNLDDYYNIILGGLQYVSMLQPMYLEPTGGESTPMGKKKSVDMAVLSFYKTIEGLIGTVIDKSDDRALKANPSKFKIGGDYRSDINYKVEELNFRKTSDVLGYQIDAYTGQKLAYVPTSWHRIQGFFIVQNLPLPMTILSMALDMKIGKEV